MKPNRFNFRVYVKKYNKIYRVCELHTDNEYLTVQICDNDNTVVFDKDKKINPTLFSKNEIELMQSTGLVDKNGKEIFESDIIKSDFLGIGIIKYSENLKRFTVINPNYADEEDYCGDMTWDDFIEEFNENQYEVVGNIYENPELLEEFRKKLKEFEKKLEIFMKNLNF